MNWLPVAVLNEPEVNCRIDVYLLVLYFDSCALSRIEEADLPFRMRIFVTYGDFKSETRLFKVKSTKRPAIREGVTIPVKGPLSAMSGNEAVSVRLVSKDRGSTVDAATSFFVSHVIAKDDLRLPETPYALEGGKGYVAISAKLLKLKK